MKNRFKPIEHNYNDVLDLGNNIYKIGKFIQALNKSSNYSLAYTLRQELDYQGIHINPTDLDNWFNQGIDCELLNLGCQNWKKGKIRFKVSVEFYAEEEQDIQVASNHNSEFTELESPLDDLRRMIQKEN